VLVPMEDPRAMAREIERIVQMTEDDWRKMSDIAITPRRATRGMTRRRCSKRR